MIRSILIPAMLFTLVMQLDFQRQHITVYLETDNGIVQSEARAKPYVCGWLPRSSHLRTWSVAFVDKINNTVRGTTIKEFCGL